MKTALVLLAATLLSAPAFASKARVTALGGSSQVTDVQDIFEKPSYLGKFGEFATIEMGDSTIGGAVDAEGGFVKNHGDAKLGFYLGRKSAYTNGYRAALGMLGQENPFEVLYGWKNGDMNLGASFSYSNSDKKAAKTKQSAMGIRVGAYTDMWDASLIMGLGSSAEDNSTAGSEKKATGTSGMAINAGYNINENLYGTFVYATDGFKYEVAGVEAAAQDFSRMNLGLSSGWKKDGVHFFYGANYNTDTTTYKKTTPSTNDGKKDVTTTLPVHFGMEADANTWLTLRSSLSQNVFLSSVKAMDGDADTVANNTTAALGAGLKFGKLTVDGSMSAGTTGTLTLDNVLTNASLTYMF